SSVSDKWCPVGTGGDTTKGTINNGAAIGETSTNAIYHREPLFDMHTFERIYLRCTAIGGTATALVANLIVPRSP
ncbi:hypothetical protein, partial [Streptococcus pneumoniae]|uniref:hypothetical protein n=1 Tax=Streptococcus pneumoniae TaxID=1313 RepID=UPI0018B054C9